MMIDTPDTVDIENIEDLGDPRYLETIDYFVTAGDVYQLVADEYSREQYLKKVDEIPDGYWERYDDETEGDES